MGVCENMFELNPITIIILFNKILFDLNKWGSTFSVLKNIDGAFGMEYYYFFTPLTNYLDFCSVGLILNLQNTSKLINI